MLFFSVYEKFMRVAENCDIFLRGEWDNTLGNERCECGAMFMETADRMSLRCVHFCDCVQAWVNNRILSWCYFRNVHLWRPSVTAVALALFKWWDDYRRLYPRDFCLLLALFTTLLNVPISSAIYAKAGCWVNISRSLFRLPLCIRQVNSLKCATKWGLVGKSLTRNMACEMVCAHSRSPRLRAGCWLFEREH